MQFEWSHGRRLEKASNQSYNVTYKYDDGGLRTSKTINGTTTNFITSGIQILAQKTGDNVLVWQIDGNGSTIGFNYKGTEYLYLKNAQGDIAGITDSSGNMVAEYVYDSWGKVLHVLDASGVEITDPTNIAHINPLRYRGYYYDSELGLYYLNSRYYDPEVSRFINGDGTLEDNLNMFAYCGNNPVMFFDPEGTKRFYNLVVLYDSENFSQQADDEAKWLANAYDEEESSVIKISIKNKSEFTSQWNKYLNKDNKEYTIMSLIFHGSPKHLWVGENLMSSDIKNLSKANLISLRILSCNSGHKDYADNVANAFKSKHNINSIHAMDGNLSFYPRNWHLIGHDFSKYKPQLSHNQNGFNNYAKNGRKPSGFYTLAI